jgi:hypothetical protein
MTELVALYTKAAGLAGRPVDVDILPSGKFIVMWMSFDAPPPEPGATEEEALQNFIDKMLRRPVAADTIEPPAENAAH